MKNEEFSTGFDTLVNSYATKLQPGDSVPLETPSFDEYEKSVFLTEAQEEIVVNLYNGKNIYGDSFESTEEIRRYLDNLIKTKVYEESDKVDGTGVSDKSVFYELPSDLGFITLEQITFGDESLNCYNGSIASVYPVTHDEWGKIKNNPFRGPTKYKAVRLDCGDNKVELVSKYNIDKYMIRYLSLPTPIILVNLPKGLSINKKSEYTPCTLNPILHNTILRRAVELGLASKGVGAKN